MRGVLFMGLVALCVIQGNAQIPSKTVSSPDPRQGNSWVEHLIPGITFQVQRSNRGGIDFNPWVGYRFTRRVTAGLGWNERLGIHYHHHFGVSHRRAVYGPRSFFDYQLGHGFSGRAEIEVMNAYSPPLYGAYPPDGTRQWALGAFVGAKKTFRITGGVRGSLQLLYNVYHDTHQKSPYADLLNFRFGIEFPLKKKQQ